MLVSELFEHPVADENIAKKSDTASAVVTLANVLERTREKAGNAIVAPAKITKAHEEAKET